MSLNKNALLRYQALDKCFRNSGRKYFLQDLLNEVNKALEEFNGQGSSIKRRQLFDDIKFMESDQGWAIPLERKREGRKVYYRYSDPAFSISNEPLNESEISQIEAAISVLSRFSGAPQFEWVQELIPVLEDRLGLKNQLKEVISVESNIDLKGLDHLPVFYQAIINEQALDVVYQDFKSTEPFTIQFHPYYLKQYNNRWFAFGLHQEFDIPTWNLALDRIVSVSQSPEPYKYHEVEWDDYFYDIIGVTKKHDAEVQEVVLEFSEQLAPYVRTKPIHPTQKTQSCDGKLLVTIQVIPNYELVSQILSYGEHVKVIAPEELKQEVVQKVKSSVNNYMDPN